MKQTKTYNNFPVYVTRLLSRLLRCSQSLSFIAYSLLFSAALLTACSDDTEWSGAVVDNVEVQLCTTDYNEEGDMSRMGYAGSWGTTRSWAPPSGFVTFSNIWGSNGPLANQKDLVHKSITVFFTEDNGKVHETTMFYKNDTDGWQMRSEDELIEGGYYVYGFIPKEDATSVTISSNGNYANGAVLTLKGLNTMTASDVCVIVGASNDRTWSTTYNTDSEDHTVTGLRAGNFNVKFSGEQGVNNYLFLLFDHIYSALRFKFTIDSKYAELRSIKLRKLELVAYKDNEGKNPVKAKYNATVTLKKTDPGDDSSPIVGNVDFTEDDSSADLPLVPIFNPDDDPAKYVTLTTTKPYEFMGCFVPGDHPYFKLRTTYDVYDKQGNLIRQRCQAENSFNLSLTFGSFMESVRGHSYDYTLKVQPTYLYVLSEPDLDTPTVKIN